MNQTPLQEKNAAQIPSAEPSLHEQPQPSLHPKWHALRILTFAVTMLIVALIGTLIFLRPTESESEKRELTKFPELTWDSLISGDYFSGITVWYADTFPGRESLIKINQKIQSLYGIRTTQIIRSDKVDPNDTFDPTAPEADIPIDRLGSVYVKGNTAYELYKETVANSERYAELITKAAEQLKGKATVYDMIIPLSSSVNLSEKELQQVGFSDAEAAIDRMFGQMSGIVPVEVYDILRQHNDEYLYFRTDHHWTALGAYYSYVKFCEAAGMTPYLLSDWQEYQFEGFLGTLYAEAGSPPQLGDTPDTVHAWVPKGTNDIYIVDKTGNRLRYRGGLVRTDTDTFYANAASKYNCFIMGDNPLSEIHNETIKDGSSIVVVKESFGNALVPFLVDHYEYVYVVDYRYFTNTTGKTLQEFVTEKGVDTVLFINNLTATSTTQRLYEIDKLLGK